MIIPIRCMNCGHILADKWRWYQRRVKELQGAAGLAISGTPMYMDGTTVPVTAEKTALDELGLKRYCCRKHMLTHVDLAIKV